MIVFDEQDFISSLTSVVKKAFAGTEWRTLFGGKNMKFVEENFGEETSFPVTYIGVEDWVQATNTYASNKDEQYTRVEFEIECYNQEVGKKTKRDIGLAINKQLVKTLKEYMNPHIEENTQVSSQDESLYRRRVTGYVIYDNINKIFYR